MFFIFILLSSISINVRADMVFLVDYSKHNPSVDGVLTTQNGKDPSCSGHILIDRIKSTSTNNEMLRIETTKKNEFDIGFDITNINFEKSQELIKFLSYKGDVIFIGDRCGARGGILMLNSFIKLSSISK